MGYISANRVQIRGRLCSFCTKTWTHLFSLPATNKIIRQIEFSCLEEQPVYEKDYSKFETEAEVSKQADVLKWACIYIYIYIYICVRVYICVCVYIRACLYVFVVWNNITIIIIILSFHLHGYPWAYLSTPPFRSSLQAGPQGYIPYPHGAALCRFELVALAMSGGPLENIAYELVTASPAVSCMSGSSNFDSFRDGW